VVNKVVSDRPSSVFVEALVVPDARLFVNKVMREEFRFTRLNIKQC
jgi:hypothetical protein